MYTNKDGFEINDKCNVWISYYDDNSFKNSISNDIYTNYNYLPDFNVHKFSSRNVGLSCDNINELSAFFVELTAQYYVWKNNLKSDWVCFTHDTRCFTVNHFTNEFGNQIQTDTNCVKVVRLYTNINNNKTLNTLINEEFGDKINSDIKNFLNINNYNNILDYYNNSNYLYIGFNMYLLKYEYFDKYMEFIFNLFKYIVNENSINSQVDLLMYVYNSVPNFEDKLIRIFAYLSERLSYAYFVYELNLKVETTQWVTDYLEFNGLNQKKHKIKFLID